MSTTIGNPNLASHIDESLTKVNSARTRWGLNTITISNRSIGYLNLSSHIGSMKTGLEQAKTTSGSPANLSGITDYTAGVSFIKGTLIDLIQTKATEIQNYCSCNCNDCSCNCNDCSCACDHCSCECNDCGCQSYTCSCVCDYCSCDVVCSCQNDWG